MVGGTQLELDRSPLDPGAGEPVIAHRPSLLMARPVPVSRPRLVLVADEGKTSLPADDADDTLNPRESDRERERAPIAGA
jgi:hypothetical protein